MKGKRIGRLKKWDDSINKWTGMDLASSSRADADRTRLKGTVKSSVVP